MDWRKGRSGGAQIPPRPSLRGRAKVNHAGDENGLGQGQVLEIVSTPFRVPVSRRNFLLRCKGRTKTISLL